MRLWHQNGGWVLAGENAEPLAHAGKRTMITYYHLSPLPSHTAIAPGAPFMKLYHVRQQLVSKPLADVVDTTYKALDNLAIDVPQGPVAITAGSRGINNIAIITKACGGWLRSRGAEPFIVSAMGSHNGATAEGQRAMVESLGITEEAMGMPIRATMETVTVGELPTGPITIDKNCYE